MSELRFIRIKEVKQRTSLSSTHIYRLISRGEFPAQRRLSHRVAVWLESDISKWLEDSLEQQPR